MTVWHDDDHFWSAMAPLIFDTQRWTEAAQDIDQIVTLAGLRQGESVLDLCCGPGRHSIELARRGFSVVGVDRTASYLDEARRRAAAENRSVEFVQDDMRRFCRPQSFDAAVNLYTSFGYFTDIEDDRRVLKNLRQSLRPGGRLILDLVGKETVARIFREREWFERDGLIRLEERTISQDWSWIDCRWILLDGQKRHEFMISHRLYSAAELTGQLLQCGFGSTRVYGDLAGVPYDHNARRLVVVAELARS